MRINRATVVPIALPLHAPLASAHGPILERHGALLILDGVDGRRGLGEATPIAGFGLETAARAREAVAALAAAALGADPCDLDGLLDAAEQLAPDAPCARAAFDTALHDLAAQAAGVPLPVLLARGMGGSARGSVPLAALLASPAPADAAREAQRAVAAGFACLKLKIGAAPLDRDEARVAAVRAAVGPDVSLRLDANGGFGDARAARQALERLARHQLELVEQPVPAWDVAGMAELRAWGLVPIAADEAASDPAGIERVLAASAADVIVLKPSALGGLRASTRAARRALEAGCQLFVTSLLDGAVARAAALALAAALPAPLRPCGLATGTLLAADLADPEPIAAGALAPAAVPGLGLALDPASVAGVAEGRGRVLVRRGEAAA